MYYATLKNNQLITPSHDGAQFIIDVDGPGAYEVRTCRERGGVVEFGSGLVEVTQKQLKFAKIVGPDFMAEIPITDHKVVILTCAQYADYAQKKR